MSDPTDPPDPEAVAANRRSFLKRAGALVAAAPLATVVHAVAMPGDGTAAATARPRKPAARPTTDPFAAARPDVSICRTAAERATLEQQWKGMVDLVRVVREAPLDAATEPVTIFAALPRPAGGARRARGKG